MKAFVTRKDGKLYRNGKLTHCADLMKVKPADSGKHAGIIVFIDDKDGLSDGDYFEDVSARKPGKHRATVYHSSVHFGRLKSYFSKE